MTIEQKYTNEILEIIEPILAFDADPMLFMPAVAKVGDKIKEILAGQVEPVVKPDACGKWQKEKPNKPCLMVVKKCGLDNLEYQLFELQYYQGYLAVICDDGEEWGDYDSLQALEYFVIEYYDSKHSV